MEDPVVRIKYACLAILSSVLLQTNTKIKISIEHAKAIEDLDEFFFVIHGEDLLLTCLWEVSKKETRFLCHRTP